MPRNPYQPVDQIPLEDLQAPDIESQVDYRLAGGVEQFDDDSDGASDTSQIFAEIDTFAKSSGTEETFENDHGFQARWNAYRAKPTSPKLVFAVFSIACLALWVVLLMVYSHGNARQRAAQLWHTSNTNIVSLNNRNISLNSYSPRSENVTFDGFRRGIYAPSYIKVRWLAPAQFPASEDDTSKGYYVTLKDGSLRVLSADSSYERKLLDSNQFAYDNTFYYASDIDLNPGHPIDTGDAWHILSSDLVSQWRHSSFGLYWLWHPVTGSVVPIQPSGSKSAKSLCKLHFAKFDPTGENVVFGYRHNLHLLNIATLEVTQITDTGDANILNGKPDWVYEEEVYPKDHMCWWSPDSKYLVYAVTNDTEVSSYDFNYYVKGEGEVAMSYADLEERKDEINQYPKHTSVKYPKTGTKNPTIKLFCYNVASGSNVEISGLQDNVVNTDYILYDVIWLSIDDLLIKITDRASSVMEKKLFHPSASQPAETVAVVDSATFNGWFEKAPPITVVKNKDSVKYLDRVVVNNLVQLALFDSPQAETYSKLLGPIQYNSPIVYDKAEDCVFGLFGTNLNSSFGSVQLSSGEKTTFACDGKYQINPNPSGRFVELSYMGPGQPWQKLVNMAVLVDGKIKIDQIEASNERGRLAEILSKTNLPTKVYTTVEVGTERARVNMIEIFPPNFNGKAKHPLLVFAYGGPGSTTVDYSYNVDFQDIVSSQLNAVVLIIDPRGTGSDDWNLKSNAKKRMGFWEPRDITSITKDYVKKNKYIDADKTAIWGWSYGGFTALKTLEYDKGETFKYGAAVAPVTNWLFYDSIYTERIMGSPAENENYKAISRINGFEAFKDVQRFLIMQGTADDNVHMQNTLWLLDNFDIAGVENYDVHFFPDSDHSIIYHNANNMVYDRLFWWLKNAFNGVYQGI